MSYLCSFVRVWENITDSQFLHKWNLIQYGCREGNYQVFSCCHKQRTTSLCKGRFPRCLRAYKVKIWRKAQCSLSSGHQRAPRGSYVSVALFSHLQGEHCQVVSTLCAFTLHTPSELLRVVPHSIPSIFMQILQLSHAFPFWFSAPDQLLPSYCSSSPWEGLGFHGYLEGLVDNGVLLMVLLWFSSCTSLTVPPHNLFHLLLMPSQP